MFAVCVVSRFIISRQSTFQLERFAFVFSKIHEATEAITRRMKLVLLPGLDGTGVLFRPLLAALPSTIEPVVVSYPTHEPLGYRELVPLVQKALPRDEPFILLGESFGGPLSLRIAADKPAGLRGLILCGSFVTCPVTGVPTWLTGIVRPWPFRTFPLFLKLQSWLNLYETVEHYELGKEAITQVSPAVFAHRVREIMRVRVVEELKACEVPILYMQGANDRIVGAENLRRILEVRPTVRAVQIESGHMILKTRPSESARAIAEFVACC
jgi:pimeloyl-[acyl-carrier protein] methyl ester esterase